MREHEPDDQLIPENHHERSQAEYRQMFDVLAADISLHTAEHRRRNEDGTTTKVTSYQCYATEESIKRSAALRVLGFLAGLNEAIPPFIAGFRSQDDFPSYAFVHLTYAETLPPPASGNGR
ncbi:hypothetical protein ACPC54_36850 [Kitasatospora sp. NPDC094028]